MSPEVARRGLGPVVSGAVLLLVASAADAVELEPSAALRLRHESADAAFLGPPGAADTDVLLIRALAGLRARSDRGDEAFVQLGWHDEHGREPRALPTDVDGLDVQQAYVDVRLPALGRLRLGRQEVALGSARLVGVRESPNLRRSFDGAALTSALAGWQVRALLLETVRIERGAFDDDGDRDTWLGGLYATREPAAGRPGLDVYALRYGRGDARFASGAADERRWSLGTRVLGARASLDYNAEAIVQGGTFGAQRIRAWTFASDTGWTLVSARGPLRIGVKANVTSGDGDPDDGRLGTFNPLFPNLAYFSQAATVTPQNHADVQLSLAWTPLPTTTVTLAADRFWRTSASDAVYRANGAPFRLESRDRAVAWQYELDVEWGAAEWLELRASVLHWAPSPALRAAGAERTWFAMAQAALRY